MTEKKNIAVEFAGLKLANPVFTASGTCGYSDELGDFLDLNALGGFITKSISIEPRKGNRPPRAVEANAAMLNAIGLANIGCARFIKDKLDILGKMSPSIFVNIAGTTIEEYVAVTEKLCQKEQIAGFELNISCPNVSKGGIAFGTDPEIVEKITTAIKKCCGDKKLMVKLTPNVTDISLTAKAAVNGGADALSLVNTFTAMAIDIETQTPVLANRTGGLSGPAIKPIAVYMVNKVYNEVGKPHNIPIMGLGGISNASDAIEFMIAGAAAVCVGTATFVNPACTIDIIDGIQEYCLRKNIEIAELIGSLN